jgi:copper chaperone CopZ
VNITVMWMIAALSVGSAAYPNLAALQLHESTPLSSDIPTSRTVVLKLQGLDCEACAASIANKLKLVPGVESVSVDYPRRLAHINVGASEPSHAALLLAVKDAGFAATIESPMEESK